MTSQFEESRYPSVDEFQGWYNLGYKRTDGIPVLNSTDRLPGFEHAEFFEIYIAEHQWFDQLVPESVRSKVDPLADVPFFLRSDADDRTLNVDANLDYLTCGLIALIQQELLGRYPLWRVILNAEHPSCSIVVYPDAIRFGNLALHVDPTDALRTLAKRNTAFRETRLRPQRIFVSSLQNLLPAAIMAIGDRRFMVVGVLDNYEGDYDQLSICILIRNNERHFIDLEPPSGTDNLLISSSSCYGVDASGVIISYAEIPTSAPYCLALKHLSADYRGRLTIVDFETEERFDYDLRSDCITHAFSQPHE